MIAYFDCFSGISGDMALGALVDAGVTIQSLEEGLSCLPLKGYEIRARKVKRSGLRASKVDVVLTAAGKGQKNENRTWKDVEKLIAMSSLPEPIKQKGLFIFKRLFEAEARVHGGRYDRVHLHELAAVDCVVDIIGTLICLDILGISSVYASSVNVGSGSVNTAHGSLPVPAPATVELLKKIPVYATDVKCELTTPTGAALISSLAEGFGPVPDMKIMKTGIGAGDMDFEEQPNILRVLIGQKCARRKDAGSKVTVIETNIDDMNPQVYEYVMDKLFRKGALDVFLTQVIMKKGRPGVILTVLCDDRRADHMMNIILHETTSIGVRSHRVERRVLERKITSVKSRYGKVDVKVSHLGKGKKKLSVEYEDCRKIAEKFDIPLWEVIKELSKQ
jgi:uncharacterized protein (TIGR00299 family) protein